MPDDNDLGIAPGGYPLGVRPSPPDEQSGVYWIVNAANGKRYIGSAMRLLRRRRLHFAELQRGAHHNSHLQAAWHRYGRAVFSFEVLEYVADLEQLVPREQYYMDLLQPEYNLAPRAGSPLGMVRSEESRQRMRLAQLGQRRGPISEEQKRQLSARFKGKPLSPEHIARLREARRGRKLSPEHCRSMSRATKARWTDPEYRRKMTESSTGRKASESTKRKMSAVQRGQNNPRAKLSGQDVAEIKSLLAEGVLLHREIGAMYGVGRATVSQIKRGALWAHVPAEDGEKRECA